jgi:hypothetical protein
MRSRHWIGSLEYKICIEEIEKACKGLIIVLVRKQKIVCDHLCHFYFNYEYPQSLFSL